MTPAMQVAEILAVGMVTPVGLDAASSAAAVRGGLSGTRESSVHNKAFGAQVMALVPEDALPPLAEALSKRGGTSFAHTRLLRLAGPALQQALGPLRGASVPLFLALPEHRPDEPDAIGVSFLADLTQQAEAAFDLKTSKIFRQGGAGSLFALHEGLSLLRAGRSEVVLAGGVDSFLDLRRLAVLDSEGRLLCETVMDGFLPGEGAAVLALGRQGSAKSLGLKPIGRLVATGVAAEKGHRYSTEPYKGDGLAGAFHTLFAPLPAGVPPIQTAFAGFNGESMPAKEWGVAFLRNSARFSAELQIEHPGDCIGDVGAASGAIMTGLAALGVDKGHMRDPCLVWCTSDREPRAAVLLLAAG